MRSTALRTMLLAATLVAVACKGNESPVESTRPPVDARLIVVLSAQVDTVPEATSKPLIARVTDVSGIMKSAPITWSSTDPSVVSVSAGMVTGVAPGSAHVIARSGAAADSALIVVTTNDLTVIVQPSAAAVVMGDTLRFTATVRSRAGDIISVGHFTWASSDTTAAQVFGPGAVWTRKEGDVSISAAALARLGWSRLKIFRSPVASVSITPSTANVYVGSSLALQATLRDALGRETSDEVTWGSSDFTKATVTQGGSVTGIAAGSVVITATAGTRTASATINVLAKPASSLDVTMPSDTALVGVEMQATATLRDEWGAPIAGRTVAWQTANPAVATVTSAGAIRGIAEGATNISAISDGIVTTKRVNVRQRRATSISISPTAPSVQAGQTAQLTARVLDQQGTDMTQPVAWASGSPAIASVSPAGLVSGHVAGNATITATSGTLASSVVAAVENIPVATVQVSPATLTLIVGQEGLLRATAYAADQSVLAGRTASWASQNSAVATVSPSGVVRGIAVGSATIQATIEGRAATAVVTVNAVPPAPVKSVQVTLAQSTLDVGQTTQATAVLKDAAGNTLTGRPVSWTSLDDAVARVSPSGLVTAYGGGTIAILATSEGITGAASVTVNQAAPAPVAQVQLSLPATDLTVGQAVQSTVTLRDAQGNVLTGRTITYSTDNPLVAGISATGLVSAIGAGTTTVRVASGGVSDTAVVRVADAAPPASGISTILVGAPLSDLSVGQTTQANAVAKDASGTTVPATFTWTTSNPAVATVSQSGLVTATGNGSAVISASASGKTGSITVSVTSPPSGTGFSITLTSTRDTIWERPASGSDGTHYTLMRARVYTSAGVEVSDDQVTWHTTDTTAAGHYRWDRGGYREFEVSNPVRDTSVTITARYQGVSRTRSVALRMRSTSSTPAAVASVSLTVAPALLSTGATSQATAIVKDANGIVLTGRAVTFSSSNTSVATVNSSGIVTAVAAGTAMILATCDGQSGSAAVTVSVPGQVASVSVSLQPSTLTVGQVGSTAVTVRDAAGAVLSGNAVSYQSSNPSVATVSATGQTAALAAGSTVITATSAGVSGTATLTVLSGSSAPLVAELPRTVPTVPSNLASLSCTVNVGSGQLQSALNAARGGAVLCLTGTHTGNFTVPARTDAGWVVIRSTGVIPAGRMRPTQAVALAKVVSPNVLSALKFAPRSVRTLVLGVEITSASTLVDGPTALVEVGTATETTVADLPTDIAFQQVYIHGWPTQRIRRAFALNGGAQTVRDSWCSEIHAAGFDSQCTISWNSTGPILIENNTFEAASENIMFGGADPRIPGVIARDITIRRNHIAKPIAWKGMGWNVKNLIETKSSARVLVEENVLEGAWLDGQTGYAFVLKSTNQEGGCRWCYSSDWTIRRNLVRNTASGFTIGGRADGTVTDSTNHRFVIEENWIEPLNVAPYSGDGRPIMFTSDNVDVVLRGNVFAGGSPSVAVLFDATNPAVTNLTMTGNVIPRGQYGLLKGGSGEGLASWQAGPTGTKTWSNNALIGSTTVSYPAGTSWHSSLGSALNVAGVSRGTIDAGVTGVVILP